MVVLNATRAARSGYRGRRKSLLIILVTMSFMATPRKAHS
jgi:hypothetical protein